MKPCACVTCVSQSPKRTTNEQTNKQTHLQRDAQKLPVSPLLRAMTMTPPPPPKIGVLPHRTRSRDGSRTRVTSPGPPEPSASSPVRLLLTRYIPKYHNNPTWKTNKVSKRTYAIKKPNLHFIGLKNLKYTKRGFGDQKRHKSATLCERCSLDVSIGRRTHTTTHTNER